MRLKKGFTIVELMIVILGVGLAVVLFFLQKLNTDAMNRDESRKTAINAMYYALEEGFYAENGYYPEMISEDVLPMMDPALFTDPYGMNLGVSGSSYSYEAANCEDGKCKEYVLRAKMEKEDTYIKKSRNR
ncbi:MAG: type II secretion system protein [Candidatus Saccharibacteria bacterium]|nr:type II secretion system protein [Candidatus Saccharibacteria bacterium]